ncbi:PAS domain-containing protein [Natronoarchaeum rubrum]|uniref:PAS domain-containing protein n=1 Tax=Natronoarchaeum rubrum TaxID=755311 RepID=UPI0021119783|nr:PAS domain-containing protein [Natronoarchaeum rubrum]
MRQDDVGNRSTYRERVYATFADPELEVDQKLESMLVAGREYLGVGLGFVTRIENGAQLIEHVVGDHETIRRGETCPLDQAYCRRTVELDSPMSVQNAENSEQISAAAYDTFRLGSYVGCPLMVDGEVFGTVCFADEATRQSPFSEAELLFVELVARLAGQALERQSYERQLQRRTERLRAEKRRFEGIAENSFDVLYRISPDMRFTYISPSVERVLGIAPDEILGTSFTTYIDDSSGEDASDAFEGLLDGDPVENLELDFLDADGATVTLEVNATIVETHDGTRRIQGVARDISTRKRQEAELRVKDRAIANTDVGITLADATAPDNPVVYVNAAFEELTGYSEEEFLGENCRKLQGPATDSDAVDRLREAIEAREPVSVEILNYRADDVPFWNRVTVSPVEEDGGRVTHFVGFQEDVTQRKRTDQLFELLNRVLRHNLRNEMNVLQGRVEMLDTAAEVDHDVVDQIRAASSSLVELSERVRTLEQYARQPREPERIDPTQLLARIAGELRDEHPDADIDVRVATDRSICTGVEIEAAVTELIANAIAHDPSTGTRVTVAASDRSDEIELTVVDDGPGIPGVEASVVEAGRETSVEHGDGLGLWFVNWIVTRYGGSFQIRPREAADGGTVATLRLPTIDDETPVAEASRRPTVLFQ